ncbi:hypothetical protein UMM65_08080 [Aureibaculum sp. 2210JD6-5]|uniref:hypothetical protein n=1 Tax=Aureibaculum sp. 2210JD6-5 TaxID=3103957 RepID=UPI002AADD39D|nr:hypothetical protein [Aureibaculum sp. 2210JD6-5]MDY7395197.1 hypothetical protein [Aureibaculum sp. 2210JD6-5]
MNYFEKYWGYIGLIKQDKHKPKKHVYTSTDKKALLIKHLDYLKELNELHRGRMLNIENKNSQLVGQASIVISIFALFIPLLATFINDLNDWFLIILVLFFVFVLFHYILTIHHSIKTLIINKYPYSMGTVSNITDDKRAKSEKAFIKMEIIDLVSSIEQNISVTSNKGENLIYASRNFKLANILFAVFAFVIIILSFFINPKPQEIRIDEINPKIINIIKNKIIEQNTNRLMIDSIILENKRINLEVDSIKKLYSTKVVNNKK